MRACGKILVALCAFVPAPAFADIVDFNELAGPPVYEFGGETISSDEFDFTLSPNGSFISVNYWNGSDFLNNGTPALFLANNGSITMDEVVASSSGFSLDGFDLGGSWSDPSRWASGINITGNLVGGGTVITYVDLPTSFTFESVILDGFTGLSSVVFNPVINPNNGFNNYEFQIDNLVVNQAAAVPEPGTWAMMLLGFGAACFALRLRKSSSAFQQLA